MTEPAGITARDRLPRWLFERYGNHRPYARWEDLPEGTRIFWQEETDTLLRAVVKLSIYEIVRRR